MKKLCFWTFCVEKTCAKIIFSKWIFSYILKDMSNGQEIHKNIFGKKLVRPMNTHISVSMGRSRAYSWDAVSHKYTWVIRNGYTCRHGINTDTFIERRVPSLFQMDCMVLLGISRYGLVSTSKPRVRVHKIHVGCELNAFCQNPSSTIPFSGIQ